MAIHAWRLLCRHPQMSPKGEHLRLMQLVHLAQPVRAHPDRLVNQLVHGDAGVTRAPDCVTFTPTKLSVVLQT